jgi:hypothetical protein
MKALISPNELFTWTWISSWIKQEGSESWQPVRSEIINCQRVAQVEPDNNVFPVAQPLYWIDCSDNCVADLWYYKDGQVQVKPQDLDMPLTSVETLP